MMKHAHWPTTLVKWFQKEKRALPWRQKTRDPYAVWISEMMLQQTQVKTVIPYFQRFMAAFPTIDHLANHPEEDVLKLWEGLGYYSRARNLHRAAKIIATKHGGKFPSHFETILDLPGIGEYSAGAIASLAFNQARPAIDGNVKRVIGRLFALSEDLSKPHGKKVVENILLPCIPAREPGAFNEALMELGAVVCLPRQPLCVQCPLQEPCLARKKNAQGDFPKKPLRKKPKKEFHWAFVVKHNQKTLVEKNPESGIWAGMFGFPVYVSTTSAAEPKQIRQLLEQMLGFRTDHFQILAPFKHALTHKTIFFHPIVIVLKGTQNLRLKSNWQWVEKDETANLPFSKAHRKLAILASECVDEWLEQSPVHG